MESNTFDSHDDAVKWARSIETEMDRGLYLNRTAAKQLTLKEALGRYAKEVTPMKRGAKEEYIWINALQRWKFTNHSLATLTPKLLADFRDERLKMVSNGRFLTWRHWIGRLERANYFGRIR